jgi:uncharacterized protein (DUF1810 family)
MDLERFTAAQAAGVFDKALVEIEAGAKRGHWIWFVLPQLAGLGQSEMSRRYAIRDLEEAIQYLQHPVLGPRLRQISTAILHQLRSGGRLARVMGSQIDALKLVSSMTLFQRAASVAPAQESLPSGFETVASEILAIAETQGFTRCQATLVGLE